MTDHTARFVRDGFSDAHDLGQGLRLLHYPEEPGADAYAVEHWCRIVGDTHLMVAPSLGSHDVAGEWPLIDVTPSVACADCGLHGYIRAGQWVPA